MFNQSHQAAEFVAAAARQGEQLAMIVWAGGDLPDTIPNALSERPAATLSGSLVDFSNAVRQEIDDQTGGRAVPLTVVGHSYGGLTVAASTLQGLSADRLLFVNSPGLCPWPIGSVVIDRLEGYDSYAMAVPGDPVVGLGPLVHGPPPSAVGSLTQLDTGAYRDGTQILGPSGHSGVFEESSTAWENILAVLLGGAVVVN